MTHDEITAKVNAFNLKSGITVKYNFDKYGSTQVEIRDESGSLTWRGWSFEADFAFCLDRELDRYGVSKSVEEIAELAAVEAYHVADSRRPSHVHRADYATDADYSAAKVAFYAHILRSLWTVRGNSVYRRQVKKTIKSLRDWKAVARKDADAAGVTAVSGKALMIKPVRITTAGGMTLIASQADIKIYPSLMRLNALWDMRHGLTRDTHYNHSLPFHCIAGIEYAG